MFMLKSTADAKIARLEKIISDNDVTIENLEGERDRAIDRFKSAAKDLAAQSEQIEGLKSDVAQAEKVADDRASKIAEFNAEIAALRPDAEKFRAKAKADAERKRNQRASAKVGKTATDVISGARPAKKAVRK